MIKYLTTLIFTLLIIEPSVLAGPPNDGTYMESRYQGKVIGIENGTEQGQLVKVMVTTGNLAGKEISVNTGLTFAEKSIEYKINDTVIILELQDKTSNSSTFYISDFQRTDALLLLFLLFIAVVVIVSKKWGVFSILGMFYSFFIIAKYILPLLLNGWNPLFVAITGSLLIAPVTFVLSHGFNRKTAVALASTIITLLVTGGIAILFINIAKITGFSDDETFFLQVAKNGRINMQGIFLAGIIIGTMGILDDVTISQASIVNQLKSSIRNISTWELYKKAMYIGHDHIASTVNTLVLVYTGAALPLLLLFVNTSLTMDIALNAEIVAGEIVRTLVSSIGLVLAVPLSTLFAVLYIHKE